MVQSEEVSSDDTDGQPATTEIRGTNPTRAGQKRGIKTTPQGIASSTQNIANPQGKHRGKRVSLRNSLVQNADGEGFEPTDAFRRLRFSRPVQ